MAESPTVAGGFDNASEGQDHVHHAAAAPPRTLSADWVAVGLLAAVSVVATWLVYPLPAFLCSLAMGVECPEDPRFTPAVVGTVVLGVLWIAGAIMRWRLSSPRARSVWTRVLTAAIIVAAVAAPIATLVAGGVTIPWQ